MHRNSKELLALWLSMPIDTLYSVSQRYRCLLYKALLNNTDPVDYRSLDPWYRTNNNAIPYLVKVFFKKYQYNYDGGHSSQYLGPHIELIFGRDGNKDLGRSREAIRQNARHFIFCDSSVLTDKSDGNESILEKIEALAKDPYQTKIDFAGLAPAIIARALELEQQGHYMLKRRFLRLTVKALSIRPSAKFQSELYINEINKILRRYPLILHRKFTRAANAAKKIKSKN
jgi:hypothetical protein